MSAVVLKSKNTVPESGKQPPPVLKHLITDSDLGIREGVPLRSLELNNVVNLIEDPFSCNLKERHLVVLKKVVKKYQNGIPLKDVVQMFRILNLCAEKIKEHPDYINPVYEIIKLCGLPFLKEKSSDEMNYAQIVTESISQLGYLMRVPSDQVRLQICDTIIAFYNPKTPKQQVEGFIPASNSYRLQMVERSGLAETLVLSLALLETQLEVKLHVLHALQTLSGSSEINCNLILKAEGASKICLRLNEHDPSGQLLFRSSEILWNLLEKGYREEITLQLSNLDCIRTLKEVFLHQLLHGFRRYDLQLRNDLLVITTIIAQNPKAPIIESEFAKLLSFLATFPEVKSHNPLARSIKISFCHEDFEMKKLLFNFLVIMAKDLSAIQLFKDSKVLLALFHYLTQHEKKGAHGWSAAQHEELQLHALATLTTIAPLLIEDYTTCQGNTRLLMLLEWCVGQDTYTGEGNSFHGCGVRGNKNAHMRYCVRLLRSMVFLGDTAINQDLCDQGVINILTGILIKTAEQYKEDDAISLELKADMLLILSTLCENDLHRKELFGGDGVEILKKLMRIDPSTFYSGLGHNKLILATLDCIWSCIVGCYTIEDIFLEKEGIFLLLDLLESGPKNMHIVLLATLLELCDNPKTIKHINAWKGKKDLTAAALLVSLWRDEEKEMGVLRDEHGRIVDSKKPLLGLYQESEPVMPLPANSPSPAVMDVSENMRAKIYSILSKIGFEDLPGLSTHDYITLAIISRYLDFKVGEIWHEISSELKEEGIRPTTPDLKDLETIEHVTAEVGEKVIILQAEILENQQQKDLQDEQEMYAEIRNNYKQREIAVKAWEQYLARTSNYEVLKNLKQFQDESIELSKPKIVQQDSLFHATILPGPTTTTFCGRQLAVESTPTELTGGPLANTELGLERASIRGGALQKTKAAKDLDQFQISSVSVK
ncbi:cilia- and flagella-associated protein 69-like [Polypterus senegalus]|uniref:cilia- and flagella-associated protein 69-like n=1 Tax=Polypterus senegalus TaxID=55291 RepID=UPI0019628428|nr:cilia- and flagella-associated protein 69-like [Polypterus senegalus]